MNFRGAVILLVVRIGGGLGNQMFQYAFARSLEIRHKKEVFLDIKSLETNKRNYELYHFTIKENYVDTSKMKYFYAKNFVEKSFYYLQYKFKKDNGLTRRIRERGRGFSSQYLEIRENAYFHGCWQSERYFENIKKTVRNEFNFREKPRGKNIEMIKKIKADRLSVSIHVRRGDYISDVKNLKKHGVCNIEYYLNAIKYMKDKVGKNIHFYIFSDDMKWVRENLSIDCLTTYVEHNGGEQSFEDMRLMSLCSHNIIANSTFSWWGAWLNRNPNKIVIAPQKWFHSVEIENKDIIPKEWIRI